MVAGGGSSDVRLHGGAASRGCSYPSVALLVKMWTGGGREWSGSAGRQSLGGGSVDVEQKHREEGEKVAGGLGLAGNGGGLDWVELRSA